MMDDIADRIVRSRRPLVADLPPPRRKAAGEGGCGVVGLAATFPVAGRHLVPAARQMQNRGNGKGGGIAAAGLSPAQMRVSPQVLRQATLLQIAYLDPQARGAVEETALRPHLEIAQGYRAPTLDDHRAVPGLEARPPEVWRYFVRARPEALDRFAAEKELQTLPPRQVEDEFIYQNSFSLNRRFYASRGEKRAFVLSHSRDLLIFKIVGYAEQAAAYYRLDDLEAHVWVAHQRYPTKGRVWHPGGAHPFTGLNEALVHNGDLANYHAICSYLRQRNIAPLFLTDTEVGALLFDLWDRVYRYPLEVIIEALAPTTELDFERLPEEKQRLYRAVQAAHLHGSPDGPWFFIVARSRPDERRWQLLGITDTSMLRPQVFALLESTGRSKGYQIGLVASEKQAIDATLRSLHQEDPRICPIADRYWNARGGSHTDGGAFAFTVSERAAGDGHGGMGFHELVCSDKFGRRVTAPQGQFHNNPTSVAASMPRTQAAICLAPTPAPAEDVARRRWHKVAAEIREWDYGQVAGYCRHLVGSADEDEALRQPALDLLTYLGDRACDLGRKRRASVLSLLQEARTELLEAAPLLSATPGGRWRWINEAHRKRLRPPLGEEEALVVEVGDFAPQGAAGIGPFLVAAYRAGWRRLITYGWRGQRFCGCGLGPESAGLRVDVYGSSGDYLGSGLDGAQIHVHGTAQDQVGQILKAGKLVIHGDVGQAFMYGAKGGTAYVRGSAAGRPLINAVGRPRVVINGTCLDYLAESFMAGDPLQGGGFVILNGVGFDDRGQMTPLPSPYPGNNLFSLASGGAIYLRDPQHRLVVEQLNGGRFAALTRADWTLMQPYLEENARLFGIAVADLLTVEGVIQPPERVYRKIAPASGMP